MPKCVRNSSAASRSGDRSRPYARSLTLITGIVMPPLGGARGQLAQFFEVPGVVTPGDEHDVVEAERHQPLQPLARDRARALEIGRVIGPVGTRRRAVEIHPDVGDDGAPAAQIAKARDAL